jgi:hypothetical protein
MPSRPSRFGWKTLARTERKSQNRARRKSCAVIQTLLPRSRTEAFLLTCRLCSTPRAPVKADLSLDAGLLSAIDEAAERRGLTRSAFLASAAREKIESEG